MVPYLDIFGIRVQAYYVCAALAGFAGATLSAGALWKRKQGGWSFFLPLLTAGSALFGARVLNAITNPRAFEGYSVWTVSYRKLSLMGGLIAGTVVILLYCLFRKESFARIADVFTVPAAVGVILLKLGCFLNGCCHGKPTDGPFGVVFPANEIKYRFIESLSVVHAKSPVVHPTQVYEMAGAAAAIFAAVLLPRVLKLKEGSRAALFAACFALARWIVLPYRELPYDRQVITVFYPVLYGAVIGLALLYLLQRNSRYERNAQIPL